MLIKYIVSHAPINNVCTTHDFVDISQNRF